MASYTVQMPDGTEYDVEVPDQPSNIPAVPTHPLVPEKQMNVMPQVPQTQSSLPPLPPAPDFAKYGKAFAAGGIPGAAISAAKDVIQKPGEAYARAAYPSKMVGALGGQVVDAVTPDISANPSTSYGMNMLRGAPRALGELATETAQSAISPEGVALGAGVPALGAAIKPAGKALLKKMGKGGLGIAEEATETMIKKPEVMEPGFANSGKIEKVTQDLKIALDDFKKKISRAYDDVLGRAERSKQPGKGDASKVQDAFESAEKPLGIRKVMKEVKTKQGPVEKFDKYAGKKGTQQQVSQEELDKLTELRHKFNQDAERRAKTGKLTANDLQNETNILGKYTNWKEPGNVYNKELKGIRRAVDREKREHYPELKEVDAMQSKFERAAGTIRRRTGIKRGDTQQTEVTEQEVNRTKGLIRRLFNTGEETTTKAVTKAVNDIEGGMVVDDLKALAAAEQLGIDRESWLKTFKSKAAKTLFIKAITNTKDMYGGASKAFFKLVAPSYVGREEKKKK